MRSQFKQSIRTNKISTVLEFQVEIYVETLVELEWKYRFGFLKVVLFLVFYRTTGFVSWWSSGHSNRDDHFRVLNLFPHISLFGLKRPFLNIHFHSRDHKWSLQTLRCHLCIYLPIEGKLHTTDVFRSYSHMEPGHEWYFFAYKAITLLYHSSRRDDTGQVIYGQDTACASIMQLCHRNQTCRSRCRSRSSVVCCC